MAWQLRAASIPAPEREHRFTPPRRYRFDFAWPTARVALEVEGGTYANGRHSRGPGFERDCEKYNAAALEGWCVIRATTRMVEDGRALAAVELALAVRGGSR